MDISQTRHQVTASAGAKASYSDAALCVCRWSDTHVDAPLADQIDVDLGYIAGTVIRAGGRLGTPGQKTRYRFTTLGPATTANYAQIDFKNVEGDLYLKLYQADGATQIGSTVNTVGNREKISLNGLPEGTYYIEVGANSSDITPNFNLKIVVPAGPDLAPMAADSSVNQSAVPGMLEDWTATVKNNGPCWQRAGWTVQWYLSPTASYSPATAISVGSQTYDDDLAPGTAVSKTMNAPVPATAAAGKKFVVARVANNGPDGKATNNVKASVDKDWLGDIAPDAADTTVRNDTLGTATDLGVVAGTLSRLGNTIDLANVLSGESGGDWYKFSLTEQVAQQTRPGSTSTTSRAIWPSG